MDLALLVRGGVIGLSVAAAFGPIALLCVRRTLASGFVVGLVSGLGVATADALYGSIAASGLTALATLLIGAQLWLRLVGGAFLLYLGVNTVRARPPEHAATATERRGLGGAYGSMLGLTLTNPLTILSFVGIFAGLGIDAAASKAEGPSLVLGVFLGSAAWWLVLATLVVQLRSRLTPPVFRAINVVAGLIIVAFGVQALAIAIGTLLGQW